MADAAPRPAIYISYATDEPQETEPSREAIVNRLEVVLEAEGYRVQRDKRVLAYKDRISEFMAEMGRADCIVVVLSDKYLKSPFCMEELLDIYRHDHFRERIFPIVLPDVTLNRPRLRYVRYWQKECANIEREMRAIAPALLSTSGSHQEAEKYRDIAQHIDKLLRYLADMNSRTPQDLETNDFAVLKQAIAARVRELQKAATPPDPLSPALRPPDVDQAVQQIQAAYMQHVRQAIGIVLKRARMQPLAAQLQQAARHTVAPEDVLIPQHGSCAVEAAVDHLHQATHSCLQELADQHAHASTEVATGAIQILGWLTMLAVSDAWVQQRLREQTPEAHFQQFWDAESITLALETAAGTEIVEARLSRRHAVLQLRDDGFTLYSPHQMGPGDLEVGLDARDAYAELERLLWKKIFKTDAPRTLSAFQREELQATLRLRFRRGESYYFLLHGHHHEATAAHNTTLLRALRAQCPYLGTFIIGIPTGEQVIVMREVQLTPLLRDFLLMVRDYTR
jgi:hypothetical protein